MAKNSNGPELTFLFAADIARFEAGINRIIAQLGKVEASINRASAGFNKLGTSSGVASNDVNRLIASLDRNKKSLDANTEAARRNSDAMAKLQASFEKGRGAADQSQKSIGGVITGLRGLLAGYVGVDAVMRGGRAFIDNAVEVGRFEKVLETASGTQAAYAKNFQFLESVADEFRLNVIGLGKEFAALSVATRGTSLEGKETEKIFRATSMAASALQMSTDQTRLTFKAFTDMISKGVVSSEELKRQLGNHIPGAMALAARAYGVTTQQMQKMLEAGTIMTTDFLPKMAAEMEKTFGKGAQSGAESLGNNIEYAKGQLALFFAEFGKSSGAVDGLSGIVSGIGDVSKEAREALNGPLGELLNALAIIANPYSLGKAISTGIGNIGAGSGSVYEGYVGSLNPFQSAQTRAKEAAKRDAFDASNRSYGAAADKTIARESFRKQVEANALNYSNAEYSKIADERLKAFADATRDAGKKYESEHKAWAEEFARKINEIEAQAQRKATEEWQSKTERPGFMTTVGPAFTSSGIKELPTGFGGIDEVLKNLENKVKSHDIEGQINFRITTNAAQEAASVVAETSILTEELGRELQRIMSGFGADTFTAISEVLGNIAGGINADEANKRIGEVFGGLISSLGKALIAWGTTTVAAEMSLKAGNGIGAIIAGGIAVAAGAAIKSNAQKQSQEAAQRFWTGGIVDNPTGGVDRVHALLRPGEMVLNERQQNTLFRMLREGPGSMGVRSGVNNLAIGVTVSGRMRGMDMLFLQEKASKARARSRGKR